MVSLRSVVWLQLSFLTPADYLLEVLLPFFWEKIPQYNPTLSL